MYIKTLTLTAAIFTSLAAFSQITVDNYERQPRVNIDRLDEFGPVTATSSCGEVQVEVKEQIFSGGCLGNLVRTYVFSDECGNKERAEQYLVLEDDQSPIFVNFPKNTSAHANAIPEKAEIQVTDNSDGRIELEYSESEENQIITRTWVATDQCGNEAIATQLITILAPEVSIDK